MIYVRTDLEASIQIVFNKRNWTSELHRLENFVSLPNLIFLF